MSRPAHTAPTLSGRWPLAGHLLRLNRNALAILREAQLELGPVFWLDMGFGNKVFLSVTEAGFEVFRNRSLSSSHLAGDFGTLLGHSMLTVDGKEHRRMRGASSAAFTPRGLSRAAVGERINDTVIRQIAGWKGRSTLEIHKETKTVALDIIFRVLGIEAGKLSEWAHWYGEYLLSAVRIPISLPGSPAWRAARGRRWLEVEIRAILEHARGQDDRDSIVGALVHGRDDEGAGMSERELIDNLLILVLAGHETTASTLAWSMLHLASSAPRWDRLVEEAKAMDEVPTDWSELSRRAPYAIGVFRESLRMYPPVHLDSRHADQALEMFGYAIPKHTIVAASVLLMSRDAQRYAQPDDWQPERWLELDHKPSAVETCQFGGGAHFCLGYHMALLEGALFLVHAARELADWGRRPTRVGRMPQPRYLPLTHPPSGVKIELV